MTTQELLKPRIKMIAPIPKIFSCGIEVGQVWYAEDGFFNLTGAHRIGLDEISRYPHLFKPLAWYEERDQSQMPGFVKVIESDLHRDELPFYARVRSIQNDNPILTGFKLKDGTDGMYIDWSCVIPITETEYNQYQQKLENKK